MTNAEYIKSKMTDRVLAELLVGQSDSLNKIRNAKWKWGERTTRNKGNVVGDYGKPSIWNFEKWYYKKDHTWRYKGRPPVVSMSVWLAKQYDERDWVD